MTTTTTPPAETSPVASSQAGLATFRPSPIGWVPRRRLDDLSLTLLRDLARARGEQIEATAVAYGVEL